MNIYFRPPLQLLAYVRAALGFLYAFDSKTLLYKDYTIDQIKEKVSSIRIPSYESTFRQLASESTNSSYQQNHWSLPTEIQNQLVHIILELGSEIDKWFHTRGKRLLKYIINFDVRNELSWRSTGILDRFETARNFVRNESLDIKQRFYVACKYYFEQDARWLWSRISFLDRLYVRTNWENSVEMQHWFRALVNRAALDWTQISLIATEDEFLVSNYEGLPYYFTRLQGRETRYKCIVTYLELRFLRPYDLYVCLYQLNADEINDVFTRLPMELMLKIFDSFLYWPLQSIFLDVVNSYKSQMNGATFVSLISMLLSKLQFGNKEYLYLDLFKNFWNQLSSEYGSFIKEHKILNEIVIYVLNASVPFDTKAFQKFSEREHRKGCKLSDVSDH
ncbi:uncharacterized protein NPIL_669581 [Nephila pilipes]|uniref:Uncharacterized protein n=1 Tax=Nephila pilipes TaxID=299642 RepID=A0A8X6T529_NEPPI|nr:uncharacterized protein NPIL_669581 [Nephila pilipes]